MDLAAILISQYQASLEMLKQTIIECPEAMWNAEGDKNKFWRTAYHALYYAHEYMEDYEEIFTPWIQDPDEMYDIAVPHDVEPYPKDTLLAYLAFLQQQVVKSVRRLKLEEPERHGDQSLIELELQIYSIRHLMQHTGELMERMGSRTGAEIEWVGWVRD
jgi:hypothetical protein